VTAASADCGKAIKAANTLPPPASSSRLLLSPLLLLLLLLLLSLPASLPAHPAGELLLRQNERHGARDIRLYAAVLGNVPAAQALPRPDDEAACMCIRVPGQQIDTYTARYIVAAVTASKEAPHYR
jgi:hypothetical protein